MQRIALAALVCLALARHAIGQGVSGAAVSGTVVRASGGPVARATVRLLNASSGSRRELRADAAGEFLFDNVPPGGPYRVEAQAIGFPNARSREDFSLALGQRLVVTIVFPDTARVLAPVIVAARPRTDDAVGAGGPAFSLPPEMVHGLPLLNRNFVGLFNMIPQALGRTTSSIGGQAPALNAIQIDGGTASNVYGAGGPTPGSNAGAKSISLEALDEIKVLVAPFDVRQSMFTGALINAVTRAGTNEWRSEAFTSLQRPSLVGRDTAGTRVNAFEFLQYGATVGGPIIRDRLHLFVAADLQSSRTPFVGPAATDPATGISSAMAARAAAAFRARYGFDAGTAAAPVLTQPDRSVFAKLTWTVSPHHSMEFWHEESRAHSDGFGRTARTSFNRDGWELSGSGSTTSSSVGSSRLRLSSAFGSLTNELIAGGQSSTDTQRSWLSTPLFLVQGDVSGYYLAGGSTRNGQGTTLGQHTNEVTDNVSWRLRQHEFTAGAHAEWFRVADRFFPASWGVWTFPSVDALEAGAPTRYEVALPLRPDGPVGQFRASTYSMYAQDRWNISLRFTITGGARLDVPFNSSPPTNAVLAADTALGNPKTGDFPSGNALVSPRLAATWFIDERTGTRLRLGAGIFTARPPYVWLGNAFINTGLDQASLVCNAGDVPAPVIDPTRVPTHCLTTTRGPTPLSTVTYFSSDFRFPQALKLLVGIDREIGTSWSASADLIQTRGVNAPILTDVNLLQVGTDAEGRAMYGTISSTGIRPTRPDTTFTQVLQYGNLGDDRSIAASIRLTGHWNSGALVAIGYQWSRARDLIGLGNPGSQLGFQNEIIDGSISDRRLATGAYDAPHNLTASGVVPLRGGVAVAFALRAQSGRPFSYVSTGDANADGTVQNDLLHVPRNAGDISLTNPELYPALDHYIENEPCLRSQRGRIIARNSCRNPSFASLDARVTKAFASRNTGPFDLSVDIFNVPNLIRGSWGLVRQATANPRFELLRVAGWDQTANRPVYTIPSSMTTPSSPGVALLPARANVIVDDSRWRIQVGARLRLGKRAGSARVSTSAEPRESH